MNFELFPGFKTQPNEPAPARPAVRVTPPPVFASDFDDGDDDDFCEACDGVGYFNCFCGGDLCVCRYQGEKPCWNCA